MNEEHSAPVEPRPLGPEERATLLALLEFEAFDGRDQLVGLPQSAAQRGDRHR